MIFLTLPLDSFNIPLVNNALSFKQLLERKYYVHFIKEEAQASPAPPLFLPLPLFYKYKVMQQGAGRAFAMLQTSPHSDSVFFHVPIHGDYPPKTDDASNTN